MMTPIPTPNFACFFTMLLLPRPQLVNPLDSTTLKKVVYLLRVPLPLLPMASASLPRGSAPRGPCERFPQPPITFFPGAALEPERLATIQQHWTAQIQR